MPYRITRRASESRQRQIAAMQRLLIVGAALALVGCVTVARWLFGAA